jgi:very-short-patch-repair endonuclease
MVLSQQNRGCLGFLFGLFGGHQEELQEPLPYRTTDNFLSRAELSFYGVLRLVVSDRMIICPKVGLKDIFYVATKENQQSWRNKIDRKHVDFLLCDPQTLRPVMGIELDDASHQREKTQQRDNLVEAVFESAGLPILRMPVRASYAVEDVAGLVRDTLATRTQPVRTASSVQPVVPTKIVKSSGAPVCPKCGIPMVQRESKKDGGRFWGCANYPRCHQTAPME